MSVAASCLTASCASWCLAANPLLINSSMQPDLTVSRTYTSPMCFQDSIDKELMAERSLLDELPDLKVKGQSRLFLSTPPPRPLVAIYSSVDLIV